MPYYFRHYFADRLRIILFIISTIFIITLISMIICWWYFHWGFLSFSAFSLSCHYYYYIFLIDFLIIFWCWYDVSLASFTLVALIAAADGAVDAAAFRRCWLPAAFSPLPRQRLRYDYFSLTLWCRWCYAFTLIFSLIIFFDADIFIAYAMLYAAAIYAAALMMLLLFFTRIFAAAADYWYFARWLLRCRCCLRRLLIVDFRWFRHWAADCWWCHSLLPAIAARYFADWYAVSLMFTLMPMLITDAAAAVYYARCCLCHAISWYITLLLSFMILIIAMMLPMPPLMPFRRRLIISDIDATPFFIFWCWCFRHYWFRHISLLLMMPRLRHLFSPLRRHWWHFFRFEPLIYLLIGPLLFTSLFIAAWWWYFIITLIISGWLIFSLITFFLYFDCRLFSIPFRLFCRQAPARCHWLIFRCFLFFFMPPLPPIRLRHWCDDISLDADFLRWCQLSFMPDYFSLFFRCFFQLFFLLSALRCLSLGWYCLLLSADWLFLPLRLLISPLMRWHFHDAAELSIFAASCCRHALMLILL